ncbi:unnamed protein product [Vicia faba]|uniref:Uncharacterized protein n=1 Tax=Vicia faba TaxID=3906 RepID=A0AAV1B9R3_VICFA|nr:unnamed protein product [Vicia faba]
MLEIEAMAGAVDISNVSKGKNESLLESKTKRRKWTRRQSTRNAYPKNKLEKEVECGKRNLVDVMILDGTVEAYGKGEKKLKGQEEVGSTLIKVSEVVLESQHRLQQ